MGKGETMYSSVPFVLVLSYLKSGSISTGSRERSSPRDAGNRSRDSVSFFTGSGELERKHGRESTSQTTEHDRVSKIHFMSSITRHRSNVCENGNPNAFNKYAMRINQLFHVPVSGNIHAVSFFTVHR
jgi:hypothetical protein